MRKGMLVIALWALTGATWANVEEKQSWIASSQVVWQKSCFKGAFASYEAWMNFLKKKNQKRIQDKDKLQQVMLKLHALYPKEEYEAFKRTMDCVLFGYTVDDTKISGYVIKPKAQREKLPVVVFNRGGNGIRHSVKMNQMLGDLYPLAKEGFVVVGSQYRKQDEFGGKDIEDVTTLLDIVPAIEGADAKRIGMMGWSRGGMQSFMTARGRTDIKALISVAGVADLEYSLSQRPDMEKVFRMRIPDYSAQKQQALTQRSVIHWADELDKNMPILIVQGQADKRVSANQALMLSTKLQALEHPYKLVIYPQDGHGLRKNKAEAYATFANWFHTYL